MEEKRERKNERADNKRLTSRLSEWWNFKTFQIKLFIPVYKGRGREGGKRGRSGKRELVEGYRRGKKTKRLRRGKWSRMEERREDLSHSFDDGADSKTNTACLCVGSKTDERESAGRCLHSLCGRLKAVCRGQRDKRGKREKERKTERDREGRIK